MSKIDKASSSAYKVGKYLRWVKAIKLCFKEKSLAPLVRRVGNVLIGRHIVSKLWLRK